jgi:hypothetical protein
VAEQLALIQDLVDNLLRAADENRTMRGCAFLIVGPGDLLCAILRGCVGEKVAGIVRIKRVQTISANLFIDRRVPATSRLASLAMTSLGQISPVALRRGWTAAHPSIAGT